MKSDASAPVRERSPRDDGPWAAPNIALCETFGWRRHVLGEAVIWTKGYGSGADADTIEAALKRWSATPAAGVIAEWALGLGGHFAFVIAHPDFTLAAVDRVRSIPVAWSDEGTGAIDDQALRLLERAQDRRRNADAALALAMSGYTIDVATLFPSIRQLGPGEFVLFSRGAQPARHRYYTYAPWRADKPAYIPELSRKHLAEQTLGIIDTMMKSVGDRILAVPLSAGRDSRLIVSAAHHLGYRNIRAFSYGWPGNHEAEVSKAIADRLGFQWRFVPMGVGFMRRHYASDAYREYLAFADTLQSVPFVQDLPQLMQLKNEGYVPADAVIANGNSGDYISGNHVVAAMQPVLTGAGVDERRSRVVQSLYDKHFALWDYLRRAENKTNIVRQIDASIDRAGALFADPKDDYGIHEYAEFQDRQCKYVITGQRIYEFLGHEWRLPLWDNAYLDFFETVPLEGKVGQKLYSDMLQAENWGGVWQNIAVNRKTIRPHWIRPLRQVARAAHAALGREAWHRFERRYLRYWMENGSHSAVRPYLEIAGDRRGARHGVAWLTEAYLRSHGFAAGVDGV